MCSSQIRNSEKSPLVPLFHIFPTIQPKILENSWKICHLSLSLISCTSYLFSSAHTIFRLFLSFLNFGCKTNYFSVQVCAICNHLLMEFFRRVSNKFWKAEMRKNVSEQTFSWKTNCSIPFHDQYDENFKTMLWRGHRLMLDFTPPLTLAFTVTSTSYYWRNHILASNFSCASNSVAVAHLQRSRIECAWQLWREEVCELALWKKEI